MDIARAAEGGMRDAISLMDLCTSYSQNHITAQVVGRVGHSGQPRAL